MISHHLNSKTLKHFDNLNICFYKVKAPSWLKNENRLSVGFSLNFYLQTRNFDLNIYSLVSNLP